MSSTINTIRVIDYWKLSDYEKKSLMNISRKKITKKSFFKCILNPFQSFKKPKENKKRVSRAAFDCISYLKRHGLHTKDIFKLSSDEKATKELTKLIETTKEVDLSKYDIFTIANALRNYIREGLDGLIPPNVALALKKRMKNNDYDDFMYLSFTMREDRRDLLGELFSLFAAVDRHSAVNLMTISNILKIVAPTIFPSIVQTNIKEFLPFVKLMNIIYQVDCEYVPIELVNKL